MTEEKKPNSVRAIALTLIFATVAGLALFGFPGGHKDEKNNTYNIIDLLTAKDTGPKLRP